MEAHAGHVVDVGSRPRPWIYVNSEGACSCLQAKTIACVEKLGLTLRRSSGKPVERRRRKASGQSVLGHQ